MSWDKTIGESHQYGDHPHISPFAKRRTNAHCLCLQMWILVYMLLQLWWASHLEAWSLCSLYPECRGVDVWDGSCAGIRPYDHSQPVAHMSSLSFSTWIKSALFVLQNQRLHAGSSHGIVGQQKLGRRRSQCQICCVAPTSLNPGLHPTTTHCCRPGRLVRIFFQSRSPWKGAQLYLSALWGPNQ